MVKWPGMSRLLIARKVWVCRFGNHSHRSFTRIYQDPSMKSSVCHVGIQAYEYPFNYPLICMLSLPTPFHVHLGLKFLTDLSTFKLLLSGMLYHTIFVLIIILLKLILFSRYLLFNFTSSWKLTFFFIPIILSLLSTGLTPWNFDLACLEL